MENNTQGEPEHIRAIPRNYQRAAIAGNGNIRAALALLLIAALFWMGL